MKVGKKPREKTMNIAYNKGKAAWWLEMKETDNPYNPNTEQYSKWLEGFHDAENEWLYKDCLR